MLTCLCVSERKQLSLSTPWTLFRTESENKPLLCNLMLTYTGNSWFFPHCLYDKRFVVDNVTALEAKGQYAFVLIRLDHSTRVQMQFVLRLYNYSDLLVSITHFRRQYIISHIYKNWAYHVSVKWNMYNRMFLSKWPQSAAPAHWAAIIRK